jgi:putative DNA primase/helicase
MFLPVVRAKELFQKRYNRGAWVDVDAVLAEFEDWTDRTQWPRRREGDGVHEDGETVDPTTKPGVIGDFCRAYPISEAIAAFDLPYVHVRDNRWTYTLGSRPEGVIVYDEDKKAQSHHDTDPARGQTNAFDLVRLHKFGGLDTEAFTDVPVTERPSFREMTRLAADDPRVRRQAAQAGAREARRSDSRAASERGPDDAHAPAVVGQG